MHITRIVIQNYRSIKNIEIDCSSKINAFIGENSAGKSNIFHAINWILGPVYPTFNYTTAIDHYLGETENKIKIELKFNDGNSLCLDEEGFNGRPGLIYSGNTNRGINDETRTRLYGAASLGIDRQIVDYLPSNRWSLMGRLLLEINELFKQEEFLDPDTGETISKPEYLKKELETLRDDVLFTVRNENGTEVMKQFIQILRRESAKQLNRPEADFNVDLNLYDPWNFYRTLQLIVKESETNLQFQASSLGMGVQASISIAILKAYSQIKLNNNTPLFIDEPELFLHPQAQRNFYKILWELADNGTQIFYTTHSPDFVNVARFNEIFLIRKNVSNGTYVRYAQPSSFITDLRIRKGITTNVEELMLHYKNAYQETGDTQKANEGFFAKKIILVEGQSESLILPYFFNLINFDYIGKNISMVRCGDKNEIDRFYRLYSEFGIPCFVIFDGDRQNEGTEAESDTIASNKAILSLFSNELNFPDSQTQNKYLGFERTINQHLGIQTSKKGLSLFKEVRRLITTAEQVPGWAQNVATQVEALTDNVSSVLKNA